MQIQASSRDAPLSRQIPSGLVPLLLANVAATVLHYLDNIIFFADYPEPSWVTPHLVDAFWFFMTPFAGIGYWLMRRGLVHHGSVALYVYAAMSLLVVGHYLYAPIFDLPFRINLFILMEVIMAVLLSGCVLVYQLRFAANRRRLL